MCYSALRWVVLRHDAAGRSPAGASAGVQVFCEAVNPRKLKCSLNVESPFLPSPLPPSTVLTLRYSKKVCSFDSSCGHLLIPRQILLSLREVIYEEHRNARATLLEYLRRLRSAEWNNFVDDAKILAEESTMHSGPTLFDDENVSEADDQPPFYCIGVESSSP